jgi:hypothetical protein
MRIRSLLWIIPAVGCGEAPTVAAPIANYFASSNGGRVVASSRLGSPEKLIDGSESETSGTSFGEASRVGATVSVDVETARAVTATSFRLRAAHDDGATLFRRALNGFRLDADRDGDGAFETLVLERTIPTDYSMVPGNASGPKVTELDLTLTFSAITARRWRFSATQGVSNNSPFDGPRIREIELYARP